MAASMASQLACASMAPRLAYVQSPQAQAQDLSARQRGSLSRPQRSPDVASSLGTLVHAEQLLEYQGMTYILRCLRNSPATRQVSGTPPGFSDTSKPSKPHELLDAHVAAAFENFAVLVVQDQESAAMTNTGHKHYRDWGREFILVIGNDWKPAAQDEHLRPDTPTYPTPPNSDQHQHEPSLQSLDLTKRDELFRFMVRLTQRNRGGIPTRTHARIVQKFLRCFAKSFRRQSVLCDSLWFNFRHYIIFADVNRIRACVRRGEAATGNTAGLVSHIREYLTMPIDVLNTQLLALEPDQRQFRQLPHGLKQEHKDFLHEHYYEVRRLGKLDQANGGTLLPDYVGEEQFAIPFYAGQRMFGFHSLARYLLITCDESLEKVQKLKERYWQQATLTQTDLIVLMDAMDDAHYAYDRLCVFISSFKEFLQVHCENLERCLSLNDILQAGAPEPAAHAPVPFTNPAAGSASSDDEAPADGPSTDEYEENLLIEHIWQTKGWAAASTKYLELGVRHLTATMSLAWSMSNARYAKAMLSAPLHIITVTEPKNELPHPDMTRIVEKYAKHLGKHTNRIMELLENDHAVNGCPEPKAPMHPESILLTIAMHAQLSAAEYYSTLVKTGYRFKHSGPPPVPFGKLPLMVPVLPDFLPFRISIQALRLCSNLSPVLGTSSPISASRDHFLAVADEQLRAVHGLCPRVKRNQMAVKSTRHRMFTPVRLPIWTPAGILDKLNTEALDFVNQTMEDIAADDLEKRRVWVDEMVEQTQWDQGRRTPAMAETTAVEPESDIFGQEYYDAILGPESPRLGRKRSAELISEDGEGWAETA